jgi:Fur family transcriptional regulator, ferric uptake regulator
VWDILRGDHHAWSIDELVAEIGRRGHRTTRSSVLRAAFALERQGEAQRIDLGDGLQRYEAGAEHHEHIRCERCGAVREIAGCLLEPTPARVERMTGFEVTDHRLVLSGLCPDCQRTSRDELRARLAALS